MNAIKMSFSPLLLLIVIQGYAQFYKSSATADIKNYAVKTYDINNGLPSKNTTCSVKDKSGFLWVGTENGLCRFDGYSFRTFINIPGDTTSLTNNYITSIIEDKNGRIWVGTFDGLNLLDPLKEKFKRFIHQNNTSGSLSNNKIWSLLADRDNNVWIGTDDGFNHFIEATKKFEIFKPNNSDPNAIKGKSVNAIIEDSSNNLWLGTWGRGLNCFNKQTKKFVNFPQAQNTSGKTSNDVWTLCFDEDGYIWVGTYWKGLFKFDIKTKKFSAYPSHINDSHSIYRILNLGGHSMIVACNAGFYWFDSVNNIWEKVNNLKSGQQAGLFRDDSGIIWINSMGGLTKLDNEQYKFAFYPFPAEKKTIKSTILKDNKVWIGSKNGLVSIPLNSNGLITLSQVHDEKSISNDDVTKLYVDRKNKLWELTGAGFNEYDDQTGRFINHSHHTSLGNFFDEDLFRDIQEVSPGNYYLATDAGLKIYHSGSNTFRHYFNQQNKPYTLSNNHLYCLQEDPNTDVWIGTVGGGLNRFVQSSQRFYTYLVNDKKKGSISNNDIHSIFLDSHQNIWICTQDGLNKYIRSTDSFEVYSKSAGFASNVFRQMIEDRKGNLWIVTEAGVSSLNPQTMKVVNFDEGDGVFANSTICKVNDHQILLSGNKGLISFDPLAINNNKIVPPIYLSDFQVFNKSIVPGSNSSLKEPIQYAKEIILNYDQSVFSIEFVALNYTYTEKNRYAYKLEGFDKKWNYVDGQRKATYTNLNPGKYIFRVIASNNDDVWNTQGKFITIIIKSPWYLTWWSYLIYTLLFAGCVYGYVFYNTRQAKLKYEIKLARIATENEKVLHEKKLSFFTNISHEFRTPLTMIIGPLNEILYRGGNELDQQNLNTINRNAKRLLSLVDQLLLFRKADVDGDILKTTKINIAELSKEIFLCFSHQAKAKGLHFDFACTQENIQIVADREKIEIILFNLLSNAIKFTDPGGNVNIYIEEIPDHVQILVRDTGSGIAPAEGDKLYHKYYQEYQHHTNSKGGLGIGLFLVKTYTEQHGGKINYESEVGKGTVFRLELPIGEAHINLPEVTKGEPSKSVFFKELMEEEVMMNPFEIATYSKSVRSEVMSDFKSILIIEDNKEISNYIKQIFTAEYLVYEAANGESGLKMIAELMPDIIISDVMMPGISGIELCKQIKDDPNLNHIPIILLTAISAQEIKLKGIEGGADDYITKPFDKEILIARVTGLLKVRNNLQRYFFNEITLKPNNLKISPEYKEFLQKCIEIVENHLGDSEFSIKTLANEIGMSHSNVYRRIKSISGQSANSFIRFIRLRKAAEFFLTTDSTVSETAFKVGFHDPGYFREQFFKLFGLNPSDYIKKFRNNFHHDQNINRDLVKKGNKYN